MVHWCQGKGVSIKLSPLEGTEAVNSTAFSAPGDNKVVSLTTHLFSVYALIWSHIMTAMEVDVTQITWNYTNDVKISDFQGQSFAWFQVFWLHSPSSEASQQAWTHCPIIIKFNRHLGNTPTEVPLKFHSNSDHGVSNRQLISCLFNSFFGIRTKKTSKLFVTVPLWGQFVNCRLPSQRASKGFQVMMSSCI